MYDMPMSLQECCLDFICDNLNALCDTFQQPDSIQTKLSFKDSDALFHSNISEDLLRTFCEKGKLTDETLSLFNPNVMNLKRVFIKDAQLSTKGLRILKTHKISELEITGLKSVTVNDVIGCLGEWTLSNLRTLNVSNSTFVNSTKFCVVVSLSKLRSLQSLNVSNTEFNKHGLEMIAEDLPCLESLDISSTAIDDILPLRKCKERLKYLSMYQLRAVHTSDIVSVLCELTKLVHLDVSDDTYQNVQSVINLHPSKFKISDLLSRTHCLPKLVSLDISGKEGLKEALLIEFLKSHPGIQYLGLALTPACKYSIFLSDQESETKGKITVTGEADEKQILECLRRYANRPIYVQRSLYTLFSFTQAMSEPREDIIKLVVPAMKNHPRQIGVQMAATACLYNLSKSEVGQKVHPSCLKEIVNLTLHAMENFPGHQQLQKNALLTLCSDRILQDVTFDRYRCAKLVMECLCTFDDPSMNRMSVAICSILAAKISTDKTATLGAKSRYMKKLLQLVRQKMENQQIDITLKFTLSALWNLTDESPPTCHTFLNEGGLELFMSMLQVVSTMEVDTRVNVEAKILGLLNNIAEVKGLRHNLMRTDFLLLVKRLLHAQQIDVSYFAAGIIAHLASDGEDKWLIAETDIHDILDDLHHLVLSWEQPQGEMVAYRSFKPFFPLLNCHATPAVQLWAVWAIQHVCTKNGHRYCLMLQEEGGTALLTKLAEDSQTNEDVVNLIKRILQLVKENISDSSHVLGSANVGIWESFLWVNG